MKCTITIETSDYTDLKALIGMIITLPAPVSIVPTPIKPETITVTLKDPDTGESHVVTRTPPVPPNAVIKQPEKLIDPSAKLCEQCREEFTPRQKNSRYCSDKCSQKAYSARYFEKKKAKLELVAEPLKQSPSKPRMSKEEQDQKLKELREKYPIKNTSPPQDRT